MFYMSIQTILVTGVNGFVGHHLVRELQKQNCKIIGVGSQPAAAKEITAHLQEYIACDLTDSASVSSIDFSKVGAIIHLAAMASQANSFTSPQQTITVNSTMLTNLFEAAITQKQTPRFVLVSSGAVYDGGQ